MDGVTFQVAHDQVVRYATLVDDHNPAHTDPNFTEKVSTLVRPNVPGALLSTLVLATVEHAGVAFDVARFRFRKWCFVGDEHTIVARAPDRWSICSADGSDLVSVRLDLAPDGARRP